MRDFFSKCTYLLSGEGAKVDEYEKKAEEYECKRMSGLHKHMLCLNEKTKYIYIMKNCFGRIRQTASSCGVICDCSRHLQPCGLRLHGYDIFFCSCFGRAEKHKAYMTLQYMFKLTE